MSEIYLNNYYLELSTGLKWKLVSVEYDECELQNEDTTYYVTKDELITDFLRIVMCRHCKYFDIKHLEDGDIQIKCNINKENTIIKPCCNYKHK